MKSMQTKTNKIHNPLDIAELVIMDRDWAFDRPAESELVAEVTGAWCNYRIWFTWQKDSAREDSGGLTLSCSLDNKFPKAATGKVHELLAMVNEKLWLGHFGLYTDDNSIVFRHSLLLRDGAGTTAEHLQELLDLAISECERFYPAFQSVVWGGKTSMEAIEIALFDTIGEA